MHAFIKARLDSPIRSNNDGQREAEADDLLLVVRAEGSDSSDGQFIDRGHIILPLVAVAVAEVSLLAAVVLVLIIAGLLLLLGFCKEIRWMNER